MLNFLANHWGSILIGAIIAIAVALVIIKMCRDRKRENPLAAVDAVIALPPIYVTRVNSFLRSIQGGVWNSVRTPPFYLYSAFLSFYHRISPIVAKILSRAQSTGLKPGNAFFQEMFVVMNDNVSVDARANMKR